MKKIESIITMLIFVSIIGIFSIISIFKTDKAFSETENRFLEKKPDLSYKSVMSSDFGDIYEKYLTDQFFMRDDWIRYKFICEVMIGKKDINGVYLAKDSFLIEKNDDIDEKDVEYNINKVEEFNDYYSNNSDVNRVLTMIVPTAALVYKNKLPYFTTGFNQDKMIDKMKDEMGDGFVDLRETLLDVKEDTLYYRTDHHWTTKGAFIGYTKWAESMNITPYSSSDFQIEKVSNEFLGTLYSKTNFALKKDDMYIYKPKFEVKYHISYEDGEKESNDLYEYDYLDKKDKYSVYLDGNHSIVEIDTSVNNGKSILIIKDSYAHSLVPFIANHYERIYMIDLRYYKASVKELVSVNNINDILIIYNAIGFAKDKNLYFLSTP